MPELALSYLTLSVKKKNITSAHKMKPSNPNSLQIANIINRFRSKDFIHNYDQGNLTYIYIFVTKTYIYE